MSVTIIFFLINIYIFIKVIKKENILLELFYLYIIFTIYIQIGYAIEIFNIKISNNDILSLYLFCYLLFKLKRINKKLSIFTGYLIGIIFLGYIYFFIDPPLHKILPIYGDYDKEFIFHNQLEVVKFSINNVLRLVIFVIYLFITCFIWNHLKMKEKLILRRKIFIIGSIQILFLIIELILKLSNQYSKLRIIFVNIFGNNKIYQFGVQRLRDGSFWLQGLNLEPGYAAYGIFLYLLSIDSRNKYKNLFKLIGIIAFFLNRSLTAIVLLIIYILIEFFQEKNAKKRLLFIVFIIFGLIIIFFNINLEKYIIRFQNLFSRSMIIRSENIRRETLIRDIGNILKRPILGYSLGMTRSLSFIVSSILNIGIFGTFLWWKIHFKIFKIEWKYKIMLIIFFLGLGTLENLYDITISIILLLLELKVKEKRRKNGKNIYYE